MDEIQNLLSAKGIKALQASTLYGSGLVDYKTEAKRQKIEAYMYVMKKIITVTTRNICKQPLPIDLEEVYVEYHYGVFSHDQLFA